MRVDDENVKSDEFRSADGPYSSYDFVKKVTKSFSITVGNRNEKSPKNESGPTNNGRNLIRLLVPVMCSNIPFCRWDR